MSSNPLQGVSYAIKNLGGITEAEGKHCVYIKLFVPLHAKEVPIMGVNREISKSTLSFQFTSSPKSNNMLDCVHLDVGK